MIPLGCERILLVKSMKFGLSQSKSKITKPRKDDPLNSITISPNQMKSQNRSEINLDMILLVE
jgi:hypothetical protein